MTQKKNSDYSLPDLQGELTHFRRYLTENLGFDQISQCEIEIKTEGRVELNINAEDKFQVKRSYGDRIGEVRIWESGQNLAELIDEVWLELYKAMRRDERELRFGLAQLGDAIEGDGFQTAVGKLMAERIRATRNEISGNLLTWKQSRAEPGRAEPAEPLPEPVSGPTEAGLGQHSDDEIPF